MRIGSWARILLAATPVLACLLSGCGNFWQAPPCTSCAAAGFTLSPSPASLTVAPGATTNDTATITVSPVSSFTGTVTLSCAVTTSLSNATDPKCTLTSTSVTISSTGAETASVTATTTTSSPATTEGVYEFTITGTSGSITETTDVCVDVTTSTTNTCSSTAVTSGEFYILNGGTSGTIAGYTDSASGLSRIGSVVQLTGVVPLSMAIAPSGKFLYVSTTSAGASGSVFVYPITNGVLGTGVVVTQDLAYSIQVDSTDSWLIEALPNNVGSGGVILSAVPISPTEGTFTGGNIEKAPITITGASLPYGQMVISGDNKNVFVALETGGTAIVPFNSSAPFPATGVTYAHIPVANSGGSAISVAVDPGGSPRLYYIGEVLGDSATASGGLRVLTYASLGSAPRQATGSPIASGGLAPNFILPISSGDYVYVADGAGSITGFAVTGSGSAYTVATVDTVTAGDDPLGMAEDSTGSYVFEVGSSGSPYFDSYTFDSTTAGKLDSLTTSTSPATSIAIVAAPK